MPPRYCRVRMTFVFGRTVARCCKKYGLPADNMTETNIRQEGKMSYIIIEPLNIKVRRAMAKLLKRDDPKVIRFDKEAERAFEASHPWLKASGKNDGNENGSGA